MKSVKTCTKCQQTKPVYLFYKVKNTKDGASTWCIACKRASANKSRECGYTDSGNMDYPPG